jgi:bifunctional non-homologous end joining protein LigD
VLKNLIGDAADSRIQFSDEFHGDGADLFSACAERALEGIVSKHALAPYRSGRSKTWLKTKCFTESTFVVVGTDRDRKTGALMALLAHSDGLKYAGAAFITLGGDERKEFLAEVERLTTSWAALKSSRATDVKWCQPRLVVRVKHLAGSKTLRMPLCETSLDKVGALQRKVGSPRNFALSRLLAAVVRWTKAFPREWAWGWALSKSSL